MTRHFLGEHLVHCGKTEGTGQGWAVRGSHRRAAGTRAHKCASQLRAGRAAPGAAWTRGWGCPRLPQEQCTAGGVLELQGGGVGHPPIISKKKKVAFLSSAALTAPPPHRVLSASQVSGTRKDKGPRVDGCGAQA